MTEEPLPPGPGAEPRSDFAMWRQMVAIAFLAQGFAGVSQKALASLPGEHRLFFLACTYVVAAVLSYVLFRQRGARLCWQGLLIGSGSGLTCVLSVYFNLAAMRQVGGVVAFSVVPASALALTLLAGRVIFGERLSRTQTAGVLLALVGIVLVQL